MPKDRSGVEYRGLVNGKRKWWCHVKWRDPLTGKIRESEKTFFADSKLEAQKFRAAYRDEKMGIALKPVAPKRFGQVLDEYLATITRAGTLHSYRSYAKKLKAKFADAWTERITTQHLQAFLASLYLGRTTMDSIRVVMINAFEHAKGQGLITANPATDTKVTRWKPAKTRKRKALTQDETARLLADVRQHAYDLWTMVTVQYVLGCRFAEVSALTWDDVDMATGVVRIRRGQLKGIEGPTKGNKERDAALGPTGLRMLQVHRARMESEHWPGWERLVFPCPPSGQGKRGRRHDYWPWKTVSDQLKAAYARLGLDLGAVTHVARHTANNTARMHANEVFLRKVIGHSKAELTATYSEIDVAEVVDFAREQERRLLKTTSGAFGGTSGRPKRKNA